MRLVIRAIKVMSIGLTLLPQQNAFAQLRRSAPGGSAGEPCGGAVPIPRHPYAGTWEGRLTAEADPATPSTPLAIRFCVVDGEKQLYGGQTILDDAKSAVHENSAATNGVPLEPNAAPAVSGSVARRSTGTASAIRSGPADHTTEIAVPAGPQALLLYHSPSRMMVICSLDRRCVDVPAVSWEHAGADGRRWRYTGQLVAADTIRGTFTALTQGRRDSTSGTFVLTRHR